MAKKAAVRKGAAKTRSTKKGSGKGVWLAVLFVLMAVVALVVWRKYGQSNAVPAEVKNYDVFGVDVSKHSGKINWLNLKSANVAFAYVKATEGEDYIDPLYAQNYRGAKENGIIVGVYHFFRFAKDGRKQARHFLKNAKIKKGDLVPVVDIEEWGNTLSTKACKGCHP
jgi:lysozyme